MTIVLALTAAAAAEAPQFHLMQIEQVIGGVEGDANAQAIQLRMRSDGQDVVELARLRAWDAQGAPITSVLLIDFMTNVPNRDLGDRILIATEQFGAALVPPLAPDFLLDDTMPPDFFGAGSLTFEDDGGTVYWRLSWGGAAYSGPTDGAIFNDPDGEFGPPFDGPLPSCGTRALRFQGPAEAFSDANSEDYLYSTGPSAWVTNAGATATLVDGDDECECAADLDGDGSVGVEDLVALLLAWGAPDDDGVVDVADLVALLLTWGTCPR